MNKDKDKRTMMLDYLFTGTLGEYLEFFQNYSLRSFTSICHATRQSRIRNKMQHSLIGFNELGVCFLLIGQEGVFAMQLHF